MSYGDFESFEIAITEELLQDTSRALGLPPVHRLAAGGEVKPCGVPEMAWSRRAFERIFRIMAWQAGKPGRRLLLEELRDQTAEHLVAALASYQLPAADRTPDRRRRQILDRARDHIAAFPDRALTVRELCRVTGASQNTLHQAFSETFGVGTKAYLKARRLNGVHRDLRRTAPRRGAVSDAANRWGFWHLGQFAADYRELFGQRPSDTLAGKRPRS